MNGKFFLNDPDCLILRKSKDNKLTDKEIIGLLTINAFNGSNLFISDDLNQIPTDRYNQFTKIFPPIGPFNNITVIDLLSTKDIPEILSIYFGYNTHVHRRNERKNLIYNDKSINSPLKPWLLVAFCNWGETRKRKLKISKQSLGLANSLSYDCFEFWNQKISDVQKSSRIELQSKYKLKSSNSSSDNNIINNNKYTYITKDKKRKILKNNFKHKTTFFETDEIPPHSALIYAFRPFSNKYKNKFSYIGSNIHFSCGLEVIKFIDTNNSLIITLETGFITYNDNDKTIQDISYIYIRIPENLSQKKNKKFNGDDVIKNEINEVGENIYKIGFKFNTITKQSTINILIE